MTWDTNPVRTTRTIVKVSGVERPHDPAGVSWAQDITSDLPDAVTAGGQVADRTGSIVWATEGVNTRAASPWVDTGVWMPAIGEPVTIDVTDGTNTHRVFTGVIDTVEGDAFGRRTSKIVAPLNGANRVVRRLAQTATGGLPAEGAVGKFGTTPVWVVNEICRELGYESVPPPPPASQLILDAPLQGSTYNYSGSPYVNAQVVNSHRPGFPTLHPVWNSGRDGFGVSDALVEWTPRTGGGSGEGTVGISLLVYSAHTADALVTITHGSTGWTYLRVLGNKTIRVSSNTGGTTYAETLTATIPAGDGPHRVSVVFRAGQIHTRVNGVEQTTPLPLPSGAVTRLKLDAGAGACVAGLQVWHPLHVTDHHAPSWAPSAFYRYGTGTHTTVLAPSVRDEKARDVLDGYASALLSPLWVDAQGALQVVTGKALHELPVALTVDALRDVSDISYSIALLDHRPVVEVSYAHAHASNTSSLDYKTQVWQGAGVAIDPGTPDQEFVETPEDEEWIGLSDPASARQFLWPNGDVASFYAQEGSWWGFRVESTSTTEFMTSNVSQVVETLTPWVWKITSTTTETNGAAAKTPSQYGTIPQRLRDMNLPVYRARAIVRYEDRTVAVAAPDASATDDVLSHDTGRWVTLATAATDIAQWIHGMVSTPTPILGGLRVRFDPRVEVGQKIRVNATAVFGVDFEALVLSVDHTPGSDTTTVTARVTRVIKPAAAGTLSAVDNFYIGQTLAVWEANRTGRTLDAVAADPHTTV